MSFRKSVELFEVLLSTSANEDLLVPYSPKRLVFVADESEKTILFAENLREILPRLGLKVVIAYPEGLDLSPFLESLSPYVEGVERIESKEKPSRKILAIAEEYQADLIAVTMPYPKFDEGLLGGTIEALINAKKYPLLIANNPSKIDSVGLIIAPNPISEKPVKRAVTFADKRLDVILLDGDDVRKDYSEKLVELLRKKFESSLIIAKEIPQAYDLIVYELQNLEDIEVAEKTFLVVF